MRLSPLLRAVVQFVVCSSRLLMNVVKSHYVHKVSSRPLLRAVVRVVQVLRTVVQFVICSGSSRTWLSPSTCTR